MISDAEIADIRADAQELLQDTCRILAKQTTDDGGGGSVEAWLPVVEDVACRIAPTGGGVDGVKGERVQDDTTHVITLPAKTAVAKTARIETNGGTYSVVLAHERGFDELVRRVEVKEAETSGEES